MPWAPHPDATSGNPSLELVTTTLDPVLVPLGFAAGQSGAGERQGQVVFCRGEGEGTDGGCVDLVVDLEASPEWRIVAVRYDGVPSDRWHPVFDRDAPLVVQVSDLVRTLPHQLTSSG